MYYKNCEVNAIYFTDLSADIRNCHVVAGGRV